MMEDMKDTMATSGPGFFLGRPGTPGAFGAMMDEYARAAVDFCEVLESLPAGALDWSQPSSDPDTVSVRKVCAHAVNAARGYANYIRDARGLEREATSPVAAPDIADELLAGLEKVGVSGLALFPEGPRMLFSFGKPALKPADLAGKTVRAPRSDTTYAVLKSLGATPDDLVGEQFPDGLAAGKVAAAESSFAFAGALPEPSIATGNLILYPDQFPRGQRQGP